MDVTCTCLRIKYILNLIHIRCIKYTQISAVLQYGMYYMACIILQYGMYVWLNLEFLQSVNIIYHLVAGC